jgi:ABC-type transport system involved in multi-copper enzyme maturation permease subunit
MQPYHFKADNLKYKDTWYYINNGSSSWFDSKWQWFKVNFLLSIAVSIACSMIIFILVLPQGLHGSEGILALLLVPPVFMIPSILIASYHHTVKKPIKIDTVLNNFAKLNITDMENLSKLTPDQWLYKWHNNWYYLTYTDSAINIIMRFKIDSEDTEAYYRTTQGIQAFVRNKQYNWGLASTPQLLIVSFKDHKALSPDDVTESMELLPYLMERFNLIPYSPEIGNDTKGV